MSRADARERIIQAANWQRIQRARRLRAGRIEWAPKLLSARHINQAVCAARRNRLVADDVLIAAGFNPVAS